MPDRAARSEIGLINKSDRGKPLAEHDNSSPSSPIKQPSMRKERDMSPKVLIASILSVSVTLAVHGAGIDSAAEITKSSQDALASLYANVDGAKALGAK